jgi:hypothetical protein
VAAGSERFVSGGNFIEEVSKLAFGGSNPPQLFNIAAQFPPLFLFDLPGKAQPSSVD